jgi:hypothetical protein
MQTTFSYIHRTSSKSDSFSSETTPLDEQFNSLSNLVTIFKTIGIIFLESKLSALESIVFVFFPSPQLFPPTAQEDIDAYADMINEKADNSF